MSRLFSKTCNFLWSFLRSDCTKMRCNFSVKIFNLQKSYFLTVVTNCPEIIYGVRQPCAKTAAEIFGNTLHFMARWNLVAFHQKILIKKAIMWVFIVFFTSTFVLVGELHLGHTMCVAVACRSGLSAGKLAWNYDKELW